MQIKNPRAPADIKRFFKTNANMMFLTSQRQALILNSVCECSQFHPLKLQKKLIQATVWKDKHPL